jgi:hypothetical protein
VALGRPSGIETTLKRAPRIGVCITSSENFHWRYHAQSH